MNDLYAKLGLEPTASPKEIAEMLKQKPAMAALGTILLNPQKRAVYDGTFSTLKTIGALRHRLGLDKGGSWFLETHADFAPSLAPLTGDRPVAPPAAPEPRAALADSPAPAPAQPSKKPVRGLVIAALVVAALVAAYLLLR